MSSTIDLHIHSTCSDGTDTPEELAALIKNSQITSFALTDHDTISGIFRVEQELIRQGLYGKVHFIPGVEFSCMFGDLKCHILGYNFNPNAIPIRSTVESAAQLRRARLEKRLNNLEEKHGIRLTEEELSRLYSHQTAGRPHIAQILIDRGIVSSISEGIEKYLSGVRVGMSRQDAAYCISAIRSSGGVPVWAHPLGGEREARMNFEDLEKNLKIMVGAGIQGLECHYSRYTEEERSFLVSMAEKYGLWVSGGSDYHGTRKNITLGTLSAEGREIKAEELTILPNLLSGNLMSLLSGL